MSRTSKEVGRHSGIRANESLERKPKKMRAAARQAGQDDSSIPLSKMSDKKLLGMVGQVIDREVEVLINLPELPGARERVKKAFEEWKRSHPRILERIKKEIEKEMRQK